MDMSDMTMTMTSTAAMPSSTMGGMDMGGGGHDHHMGAACKISMLWNWNTIDACFLSSSWHITSRGMFAGSCIGVILLVMSLEFLRRVSAEFDKYIAGRPSRFVSRWLKSPVESASVSASATKGSSAALVNQPDSDPEQQQQQHHANQKKCDDACPPPPRPVRPTVLQHAVRSLLHMVQFGVAYFVMLLAMYYNGYFIICILIGSFLGYFVFSWNSMEANDATAVTVCCG